MNVLEQAYKARSKKINKIEKTKALKTPQEALALLESYAKEGYDAISAEDKSYFLKCFGIYDRPATPKQFMIRVRIPGGQLSQAQSVVIGDIARDFGKDYIDITTRMQIELRYVEIENIPTIMQKLQAVGISTYQTGVDNFRNMLNDPLDDLAFDTILPSQPLLEKLQEKFLHNWEWISALPRKFNTGITGAMANRSNVFGQDCALVLAQKDGVYGYNLYLGGKVGRIAKNANIFLKDHDEVLAMYQALIELFRDNGFRDNRNKNRLFFLIQDVGMEAMAAAIREKAGIDFSHAGLTMTQMDFSDPDQGRVQLRDGTFAVHVVVPSGIFSGTDMLAAAKASQQYGDGRLRLDVEQSLYILGVTDAQTAPLLADDFFQKYSSVNTPYFNHMIACAGTEHCPFGVIPNKPDAIEMSEYLSKTVPLDAGRVRMYWSACVKGCGIHGVGDIGFEGCKAKVNGQTEYGVHISVGGKLTGEGAEGYSVIKTAPLRYARFYVESLMLEYRRLKKQGESFEQFHDRVLSNYSAAAIGFTMMLQAYLRSKSIMIDVGFETEVATGSTELFELFELGRRMYVQRLGHEPYAVVERFAPASREKLKEPYLTDATMDKNLSSVIYKMLHPNEIERAQVFSELRELIAL